MNFIPSTNTYGHLPGAGRAGLIRWNPLPVLMEFTAQQTAAPWYLQFPLLGRPSSTPFAWPIPGYLSGLKGHLLQEALPPQIGWAALSLPSHGSLYSLITSPCNLVISWPPLSDCEPPEGRVYLTHWPSDQHPLENVGAYKCQQVNGAKEPCSQHWGWFPHWLKMIIRAITYGAALQILTHLGGSYVYFSICRN